MSNVIDLDALVPVNVTIKLGGQEIEIKPPKTVDVLRLGFLAQKLQKPDELKDNELDETLDFMTAQVKKCVPAIESHDLNTAQLLKLVQIISEMAVPPDAKELQERGISTGDPKAQ